MMFIIPFSSTFNTFRLQKLLLSLDEIYDIKIGPF